MMTCREIRLALARHFDEGVELAAGLDLHLASCAACRAYHGRLVALHASLENLPEEAPSPGFVDRVAAAVEGRRRRLATNVAVVAAAAAGAAVVLGWVYPLPLDPWSAWARAGSWLPHVDWGHLGSWLPHIDWRLIGPSVTAQIDAGWHAMASQAGRLVWIPPWGLWMGLGAAAVVLIAFNGWEAAGLRTPMIHGDSAGPNGLSNRNGARR